MITLFMDITLLKSEVDMKYNLSLNEMKRLVIKQKAKQLDLI